MQRIVGRDTEKEVLRAVLESNEAEFVAVYGRRRVGKTFLVREYFQDLIRFEITGVHDVPVHPQLENFAFALSKAIRSSVLSSPPSSWQQAFQQLIAYLETLNTSSKHVIFFDELPWLASRRSQFLPALEHFWNSWASRRRNLVLVVCGSAASWMIHKFLHHRGGLHNRITRRISLRPFTLAETRGYLESRRVNLDHHQILQLYMVMGGIPHYLKEVKRGHSAGQNIKRTCFSETGLLRDEFEQLYASLFENHQRHVRVIRQLAKKRKGLTRSELLAAARLDSGGGASVLLDELETSGFIRRCVPFGRRQRDSLYRLIDEYSLFYLNWIEDVRSGHTNRWSTQQTGPAWRAWSGFTFENICLRHIRQLKRALGIEAVETSESAWMVRTARPADKGAQIDLLIDRSDGCINLCEMKFSASEFDINKRYAAELRHKLDTFRRSTRTRKTLFLTMVTNYGVKQNAYRDELVDSTVEGDALFSH